MKSTSEEYIRTFRVLHSLLAVLCFCVCAVLVVTKGHPPGIFFVPFVIAFWVVGHIVIWALRRIAIRGRNSMVDSFGKAERWPRCLLVAAYLFGGIFMLNPFLGFFSVWLWPVIPVCLVGLLLRKHWSCNLTIIICYLNAVLYVTFAFEYSFTSSYKGHTPWLSIIFSGVFAFLLALFGGYIQRSKNPREFLFTKLSS